MAQYKYCPQCAALLDLSGNNPRCHSCGFVFYKGNMKACVGVWLVDFEKQRVLFSRRPEGIEVYPDCLDKPGGFMNLQTDEDGQVTGENARAAIRREMHEELGIEIFILNDLGTYPDRYGVDGDPVLSIDFIAIILGDKSEMIAKDDIVGFEWIPIAEVKRLLAEDTIKSFPNTIASLRDFIVWWENHLK